MQYAQQLEEISRRLTERWDKLLSSKVLGPNISDTLIVSTASLLSKQYVEQEWRRYHTFFLIERVLKEFDQVREKLKHPEHVEFAIFLYKIAYDAAQQNTEQKSAGTARHWLMLMGASQWSKRTIKTLIRVGNRHPKWSRARLTNDEKYMSDFDLYGFSLSWDSVLGQARDVRRELSSLSDADFRKMYGNFIMKIMNSRIYQTHQYAIYEAHAKENMRSLLQNMDQVVMARPTDKRL